MKYTSLITIKLNAALTLSSLFGEHDYAFSGSKSKHLTHLAIIAAVIDKNIFLDYELLHYIVG